MWFSVWVIALFPILSIACGLFFYWQSLCSGMPCKRWAIAGLLFGPLAWPLFMMDKRMHINKLYRGKGKGPNLVLFRA